MSMYEDPTKVDDYRERRASNPVEQNIETYSNRKTYLVLEKNGDPLPPPSVDDDLLIVFEKRILSATVKNDETESADQEKRRLEKEGLAVLKCNVCWIRKLPSEDDYFAATLCGHIFCNKCVKKIQLIAMTQCPLCKQNLSPTSFVKLYC